MAKQNSRWKEYDDAYQEAWRAWDAYLTNAKRDLQFALGDQWNSQEKQYLKEQRREALAFNKIRRIRNLITGYQRKNRLSMKIVPVEGSDQKTANQFSGLTQFTMNARGGRGYQIMSEAFDKGPVVTGLQLVDLFAEYNHDPLSGDLNLARVPVFNFLLDPYLAEMDLSDCGYVLRRQYVSKQQAGLLVPGAAGEIKGMTPEARDNKFVHAYKTDMAKNRLRYDEFWKRDTRKQLYAVDAQSGSWMEWKWDDDRDLLGQFQELNPGVNFIERQVPTVTLTIFVEGQEMYHGPDLLGIDDYPFVAMFGYWDPDYDKWGDKLQGVVRPVIDPQTEANKRRSKILDMIDSVISSGWKAEKDSVVNPESLYQAGQARVVWGEKNSVREGRFQEIQHPNVPQGLFQIMEQMDQDIMEIPGANNELLGMPDNENADVAGVLAKLRSAQGLTTLQSLFDNHRFAKAQLGRKMVKAMQNMYQPQKIQRILNEQPAKEFFTKDFGHYDCVPTEGVLTDSQKQMHFTQLMELKQMGAPIPWSAIMAAAPYEQAEELKQIVAQEEQQMGQQMKRQQQMEQLQQMAMIAEQAEKRTQGQENLAGARLDNIKALAEAQNIPLEGAEKAANVLKTIKDANQSNEKPKRQVTKR